MKYRLSVFVSTVACAAALFAAAEAPKPEPPARWITIRLASMADINAKAAAIGAMIKNPLVPLMVSGAAQGGIAQYLGTTRPDAPVYASLYCSSKDFSTVLDKFFPANGKPGAEPKAEDLSAVFSVAVVSPFAGDEAALKALYKEVEKDKDGVLTLPARSGGVPCKLYAVFTADAKALVYSTKRETALLARDEAAAIAKDAPADALVSARVLRPGLDGLVRFQEKVIADAERAFSAGKCTNETFVALSRRSIEGQKHSLEQIKRLESFAAYVDATPVGFTIGGDVMPRADVPRYPAAGLALGADAFTGIPDDAFAFLVQYACAGYGFDWNDYKRDLKDAAAMIGDIKKMVLENYADGEEEKKNVEAAFAFLDVLLKEAVTFPCPSEKDVCATWVAADAKGRLYCEGVARGPSAPAYRSVSEKIFGGWRDICTKYFPSNRIAKLTKTGIRIDLERALDDEDRKDEDVAKLFAFSTNLFGSAVGVYATSGDGTSFRTRLAAEGAGTAKPGKTAAASFDALFPENAKGRPCIGGLLRGSALAYRTFEALMPIYGDAEDAEGFKTWSTPNSSGAGGFAVWADDDRRVRFVARINAAEVGNLVDVVAYFQTLDAGEEEDDDCGYDDEEDADGDDDEEADVSEAD